jgi:hypothetical protein
MRRSASPLLLLVLYSLGLLLPPRVEAVLPSGDRCSWSIEACGIHALAAGAAAVPSFSFAVMRAALDGAASSRISVDRFGIGRSDALSGDRMQRELARAAASTLKHSHNRPALLEAGLGLPASLVRAPPVLL